MKAAFGLLGIVLLQACVRTPEFQAAGPEWIDPATGNLIAVKVRDIEEGIRQPLHTMLVKSPWAALIVWNDDVRKFFLFENERRRFVATDSWPDFLAALRSVPEGTELQGFYKCTVPWAWRMPELESERLDRIMKSSRLTWRPFDEIVCIHGGMKKPGGVDFPGP